MIQFLLKGGNIFCMINITQPVEVVTELITNI